MSSPTSLSKVRTFQAWLALDEPGSDFDAGGFPVAQFATKEDGSGIEGVVIKYGDIANFYGMTIEIAPGALQFDDAIVNRQHDRSLPIARQGDEYVAFEDSASAMKMSLDWPAHSIAQDTKQMVEQKLLRGLSMEIVVAREEIDNERDHIKVLEASMTGVAIVDRPAFKESQIAAEEPLPRKRILYL